ncbi:MAG: zinc-binding dehydrogenase [Ignavibacteria bacterium]|nr:zinc-binding dehydrogenase [Ignavibacteria bacterium]
MLKIKSVAVPEPGDRQVLVRVHAIGLNFADIIGRWGVYPGIPKPPFIPGIEFSGTVAARGAGATRFAEGERVMGYSRVGSHAEYVSVDERMVGAVPPSVSLDTAAAFPVASMTAFHGLRTLGNLQSGERVLIHAGAGGVGTASIQLAKHLGATVLATVGTEEKRRLAEEQGADFVINYRREDFSKVVRRMIGSSGLDLVFDSVGGPVFRKGWSLLSVMGRYVLFGLSSVSGRGRLNRLRALRVYAQMGVVLPGILISSNKAIFGFNIGTLTGKEQYLADTGSRIVDLLKQQVFRPVIGNRFRFDQIVTAHTELQAGRTMGKVVVMVREAEDD